MRTILVNGTPVTVEGVINIQVPDVALGSEIMPPINIVASGGVLHVYLSQVHYSGTIRLHYIGDEPPEQPNY